MKYKMAEKSLFAILLRSPWWVSFFIAAVIVLAVRTGFPPEYFFFGAMSCFPFVVIGCITAWRQLRAPSPARMAATLEAVSAMSWRDFAAAVEAAYCRDGYTVTRLPGPAADFAMRKAGRTTLVSCKRWKAASMGIEALRELDAAQRERDASVSQIITLGDASDAARRFAAERGIKIMQADALAQWLQGISLPPQAAPAAKPARR
jgi:restriction system protein